MESYTQERAGARLALRGFIGLSAVTSTYGLWPKGAPLVLAGIFVMVICLYLLSQAIERIQEAWNEGHKVTAVIVGVTAFGFSLLEANLNHIGLELLNADYDLTPEFAIWPACIFVSLVNVFGDYGFARALLRKKPRLTALPSPSEEQRPLTPAEMARLSHIKRRENKAA